MGVEAPKPKKDFRIMWRLFYYASAFASLFSDVAYAMSLRGERGTSDWLGRVDVALEKKSRALKQKRP